MQQHSGNPTSGSLNTQRIRAAVPQTPFPTNTPAQNIQPPPSHKRPKHVQRALFQLLGLAVLLEGLFLAFYPLFASSMLKNVAAQRALISVFPWLPHLYWTSWFPQLAQSLAHIALFDPARGGNANVFALLLGVAFVLFLLATRAASRVTQRRLSPADLRLIFWTLIITTGIFGLTYLCAPGIISQDMFLYGMYGRMVIIYHVNPYLVPLSAFPHDVLYQATLQGAREATLYGPVWTDLGILLTLPARASVANTIIVFRLLGLAAHLINAILIWAILTKLKPETRIVGTLLYAWNPLVLLASVTESHPTAIIVLFVLLAVFLFQRKSLTLAWVFLLLATLINALCLVFLPLFFRLLWKESRTMRGGPRFLWGVGILGVSLLVLLLAYTPYWQGWGIAGIMDNIRQAFVPNSAVNSLPAVLLNLPLKLPSPLVWLVAPQHWISLAAMIVGVLLLLGLWLADTLGLVLLFSSWLLLVLLVLLPTYWPWYTLLPLALAVCAAGQGTIRLALLLTIGAILSYYYWLWQPVWSGQALVTVSLPVLVWAWMLFFTSTWQMTHANEAPPATRPRKGLSRPAWISRPSWPSWPSRRQ